MNKWELLGALSAINDLACFASEEDPSTQAAVLLQIGERARAAISKPHYTEAAPAEPLAALSRSLQALVEAVMKQPASVRIAVAAEIQAADRALESRPAEAPETLITRALFEKWAADQGWTWLHLSRRNDDSYTEPALRRLWKCWQDALATLPTEDTQKQDSQHVLKAEVARPDATDRESPAHASPVGGPMGIGQPAAAGPPVAALQEGALTDPGCVLRLCPQHEHIGSYTWRATVTSPLRVRCPICEPQT